MTEEGGTTGVWWKGQLSGLWSLWGCVYGEFETMFLALPPLCYDDVAVSRNDSCLVELELELAREDALMQVRGTIAGSQATS